MEDKDFKVVFDNLQTEDIEKYIQLANAELKKRKHSRAKELWCNVIAAINKYEKEMGERIIVFGEYGAEFQIDTDKLINAGEIILL